MLLLTTDVGMLQNCRTVYHSSSFVHQHFCFFPFLKVSEGSEVRFQSGNFSLHCQIQKETLPHGNEHLLNWAQKKYTAVTSFSELKTTQDIYIKVGEGVYQIPQIPNIALAPGVSFPLPFCSCNLTTVLCLSPCLRFTCAALEAESLSRQTLVHTV